MREQGGAVLPDYDYLIIDEAHSIERVASDYLGFLDDGSDPRDPMGSVMRPCRRITIEHAGTVATQIRDNHVTVSESTPTFLRTLDIRGAKGNLHPYDLRLFYANIRENAAHRIARFTR